MNKEIINDTFSIVKALKNDEINTMDFDTRLNILLVDIFKDIHIPNSETAKTIKMILEDKTYHEEIKDKKSYYLGKLSAISQIIGQQPRVIKN